MNRHRNFLAAALLVLVPWLTPVDARAEEPSAETIAKRVFDQEFMAMSTGVSQVKMTLINKRGETRVRRILSKSKSVDGLRKSMVRFLTPADIQGTSFLVIEQQGRPDDQYLYLPALKRTRRIAGSQRNGSFMGSDFSYADMESKDVGESTWTRSADTKIGSADCFVIEAVPKKPQNETYGRSEMWIHKTTNLPLKMKLYGKDGTTLVKTLLVEEFKKIGQRWIVTKAKMVNTKKGTATRIEMETIDLSVDVPDDQLSVEALSKG